MTGCATRGLHRVDTVIASAGTGKTYTLVGRIREALEGGLAPERLLAPTFTRKAAADLAGRGGARPWGVQGRALAFLAFGGRASPPSPRSRQRMRVSASSDMQVS